MFVCTSDGRKFKLLGTNKEDENHSPFRFDTVSVHYDDEYVKPCWILQVQNRGDIRREEHHQIELEIVQELLYDHEPTEEDIMYAIGAYGNRLSVVTIQKGYTIEYKEH